RFNETTGTTVIDYSGKGNNARVTNSSSWNTTGFNGKGCLYFNGTFNVRVPATVYSNIDETVTVSLWVNSDDPGTYSNALFYGVDQNNTRVLGVELPGGEGLHLYYNAGSSGTSYDSYPYWQIANVVDYRGNWNHYAFTKDAGSGLMKIYINGSLLGTETNKTMSMDAMSNFVIGSTCDSSWNFKGKMADFRIYNRVLGATEIADLADANLLGWWTFDEAAGTKAYDQTANRNDGTKGTADAWIPGGINFAGSGSSGISFASSGLNIVKDLTTQVTISYLTTWDSSATHTDYPYDGRDSSNNRLLSAEFPTGTHTLLHNGGSSMWCWEAFNDQDNRFIFGRVNKTWGDYIRITSTADFGTGEFKIYIDDYLYASATGQTGSLANLVKFYIGQTYSGTNEMEGSIKDFRIYNKVLSNSEIAILNTPIIASDPIPADGAIAPATEDGNVTLYWKPGINTNVTNGHRVYFGTSYHSVNDATLNSPEYKGTQSANSYTVPGLSQNTTYYWRIDEVAGSEIYKGNVNSFTISDTWLMDFVFLGNLSTADRICAYTVQGLMNQKGARVFIDVAQHNAGNSTADDYWVKYLHDEKGFTFAKINSLRELVAAARNEGVISGLTKYNPENIDSGEVTVAVNLAVNSNYVPVTAEMLDYTSNGLKYKGYINCFDGLTINDITGTWATKLAAQSYGVTNLMPGTPTDGVFSCIRSFPTFNDGHNYDNGIDYGVQRKFYAYDMNYSNTGTERTLFNNVMNHLVKPGMSFGSWHDEGIDLEGISAAGNYTVLCGENLSFWANVDHNPANLNMSRPTSGMILDNTKYYVMFQSSEGDTAGYLTGLQMSGTWEGAGGSWLRANRTKGKVTWCTVPVAYDLWPALLEYYNTHGEPNDSFWTGPSGAGYNRPSSLPNLADWAALTDSYITDLSIQ
ncbi:MAG TPA: GxGYxYP family putative glycoside hydrolase, partial [Sedimentisphaerales bacterium]|nr:GxGYxYP family putative glycoside hydrolase [Sedimentisphaerales bacterium]